ncbi:lipopolysaccharide biosynthesis protein [Patescibacteria group bacterium]
MQTRKKIYSLLRWSEKYTKTDMIYLVKGSFWLSSRQIIFSICAFLTAIAFARLLPKETYGEYKYILSITGILAISALNRMDTAVILAVSRGFEKVTKDAIKIKIKWSILGSIIAIIFSSYFFKENNFTFGLSFLIAAISMPLMESSQIYLAYLNGKKLFNIHAKYSSAARIITSTGLIAIIFLTKNIILIVLAHFLLYTILRTYFLHKTLRKFPPNKKNDPQFITYGKHLSFLRMILEMSNYLDKILVFKYLGAAQLAIYAFSISPVNQITNILQNLRAIAMPKFSSGEEEKIKKTLPKKIIKAIFFTTTIYIIYIILAPYFYQIFFPQYLESIPYSRLFALSLILFPVTLIPSYFVAKIKKKEVYFLELSIPIIRVTLLFILTPIYGITGVICAIIITNIANSIFSSYLF